MAYTRALELDPELAAAALNRGILLYQAGHYGEADADLRRALVSTRDRDALGMIHYNRALVALAVGTPDTARAELDAAERFGNAGTCKLRSLTFGQVSRRDLDPPKRGRNDGR
jgi:tetratricopeptide (TPR) repeat protein